MIEKNVLLSLLFCFVLQLVSASNYGVSAYNKANVFFEQKEYENAYSLYDSLFESGYSSSAMLLKMSFIEEATKKPEKAILHLSVLAQRNDKDAVKLKVEELAIDNSFKGYSNLSVSDQLIRIVEKYFLLVLNVIVAVMFFVSLFKKWDSIGNVAVATGIVFCISIMLNFTSQSTEAIVIEELDVYEGNSYAASNNGEYAPGDKLVLKKIGDVWCELEKGGYVELTKVYLLK